MFIVYILRSQVTGKFYKGQTHDLAHRLAEHNAGKNKATAYGAPWVVVWSVEIESRSEAMLLERKLKNITSMARLTRFLEKYGQG